MRASEKVIGKAMPRVTITVPNKTPQPYRFPLDRRVVMIGRGDQNDIVVDCGSISTKHAEMLRIEGGYELRDLGSTNGIKLDGRSSDVIALRHGAPVKLGDVEFDFQLSEEEREVLGREQAMDALMGRKDKENQTDVEKPDAEPQPVTKRPSVASASGGGGGFMIFLLFVGFALIAFVGGLSIRHYLEKKESLIKAMQSKRETLKANAAGKAPPVPAVPDAAAPVTPAAP